MRVSLFFAIFLIGSLAAQTPDPGKADIDREPPPEMSFVLLGQPYRKTYRVAKGGIDEMPSKPEEEPPDCVLMKSAGAMQVCWLHLNAPTPVAQLKKGSSEIALHPYVEPPEGKPPAASGKPLITIPVSWPGKPQTAFLKKKDPWKNWNQDLVSLTLPDDSAVFPARSVRVLNFSRMDLFSRWERRKSS